MKSKALYRIVVAAVLFISVVALSSCHRDGCPNKISEVNSISIQDVS